jgi:hypothetical protein
VRRFQSVTVAALAGVAALATVVATRHGPGLSPDSVTYVSLARSLAGGRGYIDLTGRADTTFPPAYPALLAVGIRLGMTPLTAARAVNAASYAAIVGLAWILLRRHTTSRRVALLGTAFIALSPAVLNVADQAWSEPLFCAALLAFIILLEDAVTAAARSRTALWAGVAAGLACTVRYAGASLVVVGLLVLCTRAGHRQASDRWQRVGLFLAGAVPLPALWVLRNAAADSRYPLGPRVATGAPVSTLLRLFLDGTSELFVPRAFVVPFLVATAPLLVGVIVGATMLFRRTAERSGEPGRPLNVMITFLAVYTVFLLWAARSTGASVDSRTVMPVYLPATIIAICALDGLAANRAARSGVNTWHSGTARLLIASSIVGVVFYAAWFTQISVADGSVARGYATATSARSPLAREVTRLGSHAVVATNQPWFLYAATNHDSITPVPGRLYPSASLVPATVDELVDDSCTRSVYVAWFANKTSARATIRSELPLVLLHITTDGALYQLSPGARCPRRGGPAS